MDLGTAALRNNNFKMHLSRNDAVGNGERARPGRSGSRPRDPHGREKRVNHSVCSGRASSARGRAEQQPGRLRSPEF